MSMRTICYAALVVGGLAWTRACLDSAWDHFPPTKPGFGVTVLIFHGAALVTVAPDRRSPLYGLNASELLIERRKTNKIHNNLARTRKLVTEQAFCGELSGQITTGLGINAQMTTKNSHRK